MTAADFLRNSRCEDAASLGVRLASSSGAEAPADDDDSATRNSAAAAAAAPADSYPAATGGVYPSLSRSSSDRLGGAPRGSCCPCIHACSCSCRRVAISTSETLGLGLGYIAPVPPCMRAVRANPHWGQVTLSVSLSWDGAVETRCFAVGLVKAEESFLPHSLTQTLG